MSIYPIQSSLENQLVQSLDLSNQTQKTGAMPPPPPPGGGPNMMLSAVSDFASAQGLDEDTIAQLQSDLEEALSLVLEGSESDPSAVRSEVESAVAGVLDAYGLDSEEFLSQIPAGPPPPPPPSSGGPAEAVATFARAQGLDEETVRQLQTELESQINTILEETGGDPEAAREKIDGAITSLFEAYGLDSNAFFAQMPEPPEASEFSGFPENNSALFSLIDREA